ncbi:MAG: ThiF family adenylyltransferase [Vicinamibacterales bacterium]
MTGERRAAVVVGLGNVGSQLVPLLARSHAFGALTLVDPDVYDVGNIRTQNICATDVGQPKSSVQSRIVAGIDPTIIVTPIRAAIEDVPLGRLRADVYFSAPDTRRARQHVNRIVWRFGAHAAAWIDAGIEPTAGLMRVSLFRPHPDQPCLECGWGPDDYRILGESFSCLDTQAVTPHTNGPPALGALAAARMALLAEQIVAPNDAGPEWGAQITMAVREHRLAVTRFARNPACRFDHSLLPVSSDSISVAVTLGHAVDACSAAGVDGSWRLTVDGCLFARALRCTVCGDVQRGLTIVRPWAGAATACVCGQPLKAMPADLMEAATSGVATPNDMERTLADMGLQPSDFLLMSDGRDDQVIELLSPCPRDTSWPTSVRTGT